MRSLDDMHAESNAAMTRHAIRIQDRMHEDIHRSRCRLGTGNEAAKIKLVKHELTRRIVGLANYAQ